MRPYLEVSSGSPGVHRGRIGGAPIAVAEQEPSRAWDILKRRVVGPYSFRRVHPDLFDPSAATSIFMSRSGSDGFTLLEMTAAIALTSMIFLALSLITAQWLPNWRRGFAVLQQADLVSLGFERLIGDISVAEYVTPWGGAPDPLFEGDRSSVVFVRFAIGPNAKPQLEIVRIAATSDERGPALVRTKAPFAPGALAGSPQPIVFADPVVIIPAPYQVTFEYADPTHVWVQNWKNEERLPQAVRVTIVNGSAQRQPLSIIVPLKHTARGAPDR